MGDSRHRSHHRDAATARGDAFPADDLRASDAEREDVVSRLRDHAADGRLGTDELAARIDRAYAATTRRELASLVADVPQAARPRAGARAELRRHVRTYLAVMALLVVIWAVSGAGYFWPVWPALGWGIAVLGHAGSVRRPAAPRT